MSKTIVVRVRRIMGEFRGCVVENQAIRNVAEKRVEQYNSRDRN